VKKRSKKKVTKHQGKVDKKEGKQKATKSQHKRNNKTRKKKSSVEIVEQQLEENPIMPESIPEMADEGTVPVLEGYDEASLARAKTQWFFGEWKALAGLDLKTLRHHPDRDRFALMAASGHLQLGSHDKARKYSRMALEWGCPPRIVAQILVAGVHNILGRAAALKQDNSRITRHFEAAVDATGSSDAALISHARSVREMARMGLLPQAVMSLGNLAEGPTFAEYRQTHFDAHAKVLTMEVDWLRDKVLGNLRSKNRAILKEKREDNRADKREFEQPSLEGNRYHGLNELDKKLEAYLDYDEGFFVELGANDGITQSNTLYFERVRKWRGILIEPILHNFIKCKHNRSPESSKVYAACVSFDYNEQYVKLAYSNLMTTPSGLESDIEDPIAHAKSGSIFLKPNEDVVEVIAVAKTLNSILDNEHAPTLIDILSLDVEGAEIEVLKGIDHNKYRFKYLLIESRDHEKIKAFLKKHGYCLVDKLSQHDLLFSAIDSCS